MEGEKADYASLGPSDAALLDSPVAPVANFKSEENPFSPNRYPSELDMYPPLPLPQGAVPQAVTTPLPHGPVLINGVYHQPVPAPHNVVVAQSSIPAPSIVSCSSAMATT